MIESKVAVYGAIAANLAIAAVKFVVAAMTGSSAMLAEGFHSTVDAGNGTLLLVGLHLSKREATPEHPFGHGKELFFWSLIVAVLIFGIGGGLSIYEGVVHIRSPSPVDDPFWAYVVLAAAAVFESASLTVAMRRFLRQKGQRPFWAAMHASKDPATYTVIAEDSAALLGILFAACGIWASHYYGIAELDGVASIAIGALLACVAVLLIAEARDLLIGEGLGRDAARDIRRTVLADERIRAVGPLLSMYMGPDEVLVTLDVEFDDALPAEEIARAVSDVEARIVARHPAIRRIYLEPRDLARTAHAIREPDSSR